MLNSGACIPFACFTARNKSVRRIRKVKIPKSVQDRVMGELLESSETRERNAARSDDSASDSTKRSTDGPEDTARAVKVHSVRASKAVFRSVNASREMDGHWPLQWSDALFEVCELMNVHVMSSCDVSALDELEVGTSYVWMSHALQSDDTRRVKARQIAAELREHARRGFGCSAGGAGLWRTADSAAADRGSFVERRAKFGACSLIRVGHTHFVLLVASREDGLRGLRCVSYGC